MAPFPYNNAGLIQVSTHFWVKYGQTQPLVEFFYLILITFLNPMVGFVHIWTNPHPLQIKTR